MALDTAPTIAPYDAPVKDLYEIGEMPPLGHVPKQMYAWAIRRLGWPGPAGQPV
jgi:crotonyl-CoA carboxylase/reductase